MILITMKTCLHLVLGSWTGINVSEGNSEEEEEE